MGLINNLQSFTTGASGVVNASAKARFKRAMDIVLVDLGRDVTMHLEPSRTACADPNCAYDSFYKRYLGNNGQVCQSCRGQGFTLEPRFTIYRANIRWTNEPYNNESSEIEEQQSFGRLGADFVRTKMVQVAFDDIKDSIGATIDNINVELFEEPRFVGFGDLLYTVAIWKVSNR